MKSSHHEHPSLFRVSTSWGDAWVAARGSLVERVMPPSGGEVGAREIEAREAAADVSALGEMVDASAAPESVRSLAAAMQAYFDGAPCDLASRTDVAEWLDAAGIRGARRDMSLALFDVPRGVTISYGELASIAGYPGAARAAGSTCARNPLPLVIPCHRVVHAGARRGDVGSYGAGAGPAFKRRLLELEDAALVRV